MSSVRKCVSSGRGRAGGAGLVTSSVCGVHAVLCCRQHATEQLGVRLGRRLSCAARRAGVRRAACVTHRALHRLTAFLFHHKRRVCVGVAVFSFFVDGFFKPKTRKRKCLLHQWPGAFHRLCSFRHFSSEVLQPDGLLSKLTTDIDVECRQRMPQKAKKDVPTHVMARRFGIQIGLGGRRQATWGEHRQRHPRGVRLVVGAMTRSWSVMSGASGETQRHAVVRRQPTNE